jgi:hypothetical protein
MIPGLRNLLRNPERPLVLAPVLAPWVAPFDGLLVYRVYDGEFDWFVLRQGDYVRLNPDAQNICRSEVFPGLWLKADAFVAAKLAEVLSVLKDGLDSADHQEFVRLLALATKTT